MARGRSPAAKQPELARLRGRVFFAFFLSGFAGLMHQVVWAKLLTPLVGATAHAQATVLAVFLGGLALGAASFGRRVDRLGRPLRTYVALEVGVATAALLLPLLVAAAGTGYVALASRFFEVFETTPLKLALRLLLATLTILLPAICMGGTLPVLARQLVTRVDETRRQVADLYALNSFGAVLGAGLAGFVALPRGWAPTVRSSWRRS